MSQCLLFTDEQMKHERECVVAYLDWQLSMMRGYLTIGVDGKIKLITDTEHMRRVIERGSAKAELN